MELKDSFIPVNYLVTVCVSIELSFDKYIAYKNITATQFQKLNHNLETNIQGAIELPPGQLSLSQLGRSFINSTNYRRKIDNIIM